VVTHSQIIDLSNGDVVITDNGVSRHFREAFDNIDVELHAV
jgi:alpha-ketoglutarate-dependent taurine dioxygenase